MADRRLTIASDYEEKTGNLVFTGLESGMIMNVVRFANSMKSLHTDQWFDKSMTTRT